MSEPLVLGIETSCDETAIGIVRGRTLLANEIASSVGNPEKAIKTLGWKKPTDIDGVIKMMCAEKAKQSQQ